MGGGVEEWGGQMCSIDFAFINRQSFFGGRGAASKSPISRMILATISNIQNNRKVAK